LNEGAPDSVNLTESLLGFLRRSLDAPSLGFEKPPTPLNGGAEAEVHSFSLSDPQEETGWGSIPLVCKVSRDAMTDSEHIRGVAAFQGAVASLGYPAPRVVATGTRDDGLGAPFIVMERAAGLPAITLVALTVLLWVGSLCLASLVWVVWWLLWSPSTIITLILLGLVLAGSIGILAIPTYCGRALVRLHRLPVDSLVEELKTRGFSRSDMEFGTTTLDTLQEQIEQTGAEELLPGLDWLRTHMPAMDACKVICQGDFHPANVMMNHRGISGVIDWSNGMIVAPESDIAWSRVVHLAIWALISTIPEPFRSPIGFCLTSFLWTVQRLQGIPYRMSARLDRERVRYFTALHALRIMLLGESMDASDSGRAARRLRRYFDRATGVDLATDDRRLVWVDHRGREELLAIPPRRYNCPRISPDGRRIAMGTREPMDIWLYDLETGTLERLNLDSRPDLSPAWAPDGRRIAFGSARGSAEVDLFWKKVDHDGAPERLMKGPGPQVPYSWSPDGKVLLFWDGPGQGMGVLSINGKPTIQTLLKAHFVQADGEISPDGRWFAYNSNEPDRFGPFQIFVQAFPSLGRKVQVSTDGGRWPCWAPDSSSLYYRNGDKMMSASVETEPVFRADTPEVIFQGSYYGHPLGGRNYDISPDGLRFLMMIRGREAGA